MREVKFLFLAMNLIGWALGVTGIVIEPTDDLGLMLIWFSGLLVGFTAMALISMQYVIPAIIKLYEDE